MLWKGKLPLDKPIQGSCFCVVCVCVHVSILRFRILPRCVFEHMSSWFGVSKFEISPTLCFDLSGYQCRNLAEFNFFKATQQTIPALEGQILSTFFWARLSHIYDIIYLRIVIHRSHEFRYFCKKYSGYLGPRRKVPFFVFTMSVVPSAGGCSWRWWVGSPWPTCTHGHVLGEFGYVYLFLYIQRCCIYTYLPYTYMYTVHIYWYGMLYCGKSLNISMIHDMCIVCIFTDMTRCFYWKNLHGFMTWCVCALQGTVPYPDHLAFLRVDGFRTSILVGDVYSLKQT